MKKRIAALCLAVFSVLGLSACQLQLHPTSCVIETTSPVASETPAASHAPATATPAPASTPTPSPTATPALFEIVQTRYEEYRADDGLLIVRNEWWQPVFDGDSSTAVAINDVFKAEREGNTGYAGLIDTIKLNGSNALNAIREVVVTYGELGGTYVKYVLSYAENGVYSFHAQAEWDGFGPHGNVYDLAHTFAANTGTELWVTEVLNVEKSNFGDVVYAEYLNFHAGDYFHDLAVETPDAIKGISAEDAVFYLAADGIHICFGQYTFYYAAGSSELVIPYSRSDLIRAPFAD